MLEQVRAPELTTGLGWLNTDRPLRLEHELRGQVVVLDFWTYCCLNCMHILPDLAYLEKKYASEPVMFIGVHSAKFTNEASRETIRAAVLRYEITHPVVIDDNMKMWRSYGARSWPTLVVVDATGSVVCSFAGEGHRENLDTAIAQTLRAGRAHGLLADGPLDLPREASVRATSGLAFPGKILADAEAGKLYVADSNHNRIVIAEMPDASGNAELVKVVGSGAVGRDDGPADHATFHHPQGLAAGNGNLYVADTENHLIRAIDLSTFEVTTIVGTGEMDNDRAGGAIGTQQGINSPWDLAIEGSTLFVAMAGVHQIWRIELPVGFARALAGSGRENIADGPVETSALAQPSGICLADGRVYFADSEVSAIRGIDLASEKVFTIIGEGLFSFGDVDGDHKRARLQHPLGVDGWKGSLVIADTYNHKLKLVDPSGRSVVSLCGTGQVGAETPDGGVAFCEPGGLSVVGDDAYVADTNNHRIVRVNLLSGDWREIAFEGLSAPEAMGEPDPEAENAQPVRIKAGSDVSLSLDFKLPEGTHLNAEAPWSVRILADGKTIIQQTGKSDELPLGLNIPAGSVLAGKIWTVVVSFACCEESGTGVCIPLEKRWSLPVKEGGDCATIALSATIDPI